MESTACGCNCPFVKTGFCSTEKECPNYIETWWMPEEGAQPVMLKDCSPKRLILQQQLMQARFDITTQALVQSRNEYNQLCQYLKSLIEMSKAVVLKQDQKNQVELKDEKDIRLIADEYMPGQLHVFGFDATLCRLD